jgi:histidyl-tRNA synthetase
MAKPKEEPATFDASKLYVWIKAVESKVNNLIREVDMLKGDLIKKNSSLRKEVKTMSDDFLEVRHQQQKTIQKMDLVIKELKQTAGAEEVMTLKKYLDLWNPMHFVTQRDLERAIEAKLTPKPQPEPETHKKEEDIPFH